MPPTRRAAEEAEAAAAEEVEVVAEAEVAAEEAAAMVDAGDLSEAGAAAQVCVKINELAEYCTCESTTVYCSFFSYYICVFNTTLLEKDKFNKT